MNDLLRLSSGKTAPGVAKQGRLILKPHNCIGCRTCELACSLVHIDGAQLGLSRIHIHSVGPERYVQATCLQCAEAACEKVCPTEALRRNEETGAIEVNAHRCIGCGLCAKVCPFGHMHFDKTQGLPIKCDLCGGAPTCAAFCPNDALEVR